MRSARFLLPLGLTLAGCASTPQAPSPYRVERLSSPNVEIVSAYARPTWHGLAVTGETLIQPGAAEAEYPPIEVSVIAPGGAVLEKLTTPFYPRLRPGRTKPLRAGFGVSFASNPPENVLVRVSSRPAP